jgi:hypothetical protein
LEEEYINGELKRKSNIAITIFENYNFKYKKYFCKLVAPQIFLIRRELERDRE